jgi:hypothetical protein
VAVLKKASEYRKHAQECRALAKRMEHGEQRDQLLAMALTWDSLAKQREVSAREETPPADAEQTALGPHALETTPQPR